MEARIEQTDITFANIYAPNDNINQINFFKNLQERLREFSGDNMIIAGDFNCQLTALDKSGGKQISVKTSVINEIQKIMSTRFKRCMERLISTTNKLHLER